MKRDFSRLKKITGGQEKKGIARKGDTSKEVSSVDIAGRTKVASRVLSVVDLEDEHPASVRVSYGVTIALPRKFEFARLDVEVTMPCDRDKVDDAYNRCREWATSRIATEIEAIRSHTGESTKSEL